MSRVPCDVKADDYWQNDYEQDDVILVQNFPKFSDTGDCNVGFGGFTSWSKSCSGLSETRNTEHSEAKNRRNR